MSTLNDSDLFVIERSGTQYQVRSDEMSTLNDTDLFVVEREGVQYKIEAQDVSTGPTGVIESPVEVLTPVNGSGLNDGQAYNPLSNAITGVFGSGSVNVNSDEITGFGTPPTTSNIYSNFTYNTETTGWPGTMVPGVISELFKETGESRTIIDYLGVTDYTGNVNNIRIFTAPAADSPEGDWSNIYGTTTTELADWGQQVADRKTGEFILIMSCNDSSNPRFTSAGTISVDGNPTLTFASDQNLSNFSSGDSVAQDSGYTPETSAITNVSTSDNAVVTMYKSSTLPANLADIDSVGTLVTGGDNISAGNFLIVIPTDAAVEDEPVWAENGGFNFGLSNSSTTGDGVYDADGNRLGGAGSYGSAEFTLFTFGVDPTAIYEITLPPTAAYTVIRASGSGSVPTPVQVSKTTLTLTDDTDLENFRVGDAFGTQTVIEYVAGSNDASIAQYKKVGYRVSGEEIWAGWPDDNETVRLDQVLANAAWNMIWWEHDTETSTGANDISSRGPSESATVANWKTVLQPGKFYSFSYYGESSPNIVDEATYGPVGTDIPTPITLAGGTTVTAIGPGNTMSVSSGSYSVGDTVVGPTLAAATGTVASTSGSEMVLSASDGRWITNAGKTAGKSAAYDVALTFTDETELASIIGPAIQANADGSDFDKVETSAITNVGSGTDWTAITSFIGNSSGTISNLYDGDTNTDLSITANDDGGIEFTVPAGYSNVSLETRASDGGIYPVYTLVNGSSVATNNETLVSCGTVSTGDTVKIQRTTSGLFGFSVQQIKLNDAELIDNTLELTLTDDTGLDQFEVGDTVTSEGVSITDIVNAFPSEGFSYNFHTPNTTYGNNSDNSQTSAQDAGFFDSDFFFSNDAGRDYENWCGVILDSSATSGGYQRFVTVQYQGATIGTPFKLVLQGSAGLDYTLNISGAAEFTGQVSSIVEQIPDTVNPVGGEIDVYPTSTSGEFTFSHTNSVNAYLTITGLQGVAVPATVNAVGPGNLLTVSGGTWNVGDTVSKDVTLASIANVLSVDGTTLYGSSVTGEFFVGKYLKGAEITAEAPSPSEIVFTSMNGGTTAFTGTDATLSARLWSLESGPSASGPWAAVGDYLDISAFASQDGATPWATAPALDPNTFYRVKVEYQSDNADSVVSNQNTFKTGDA